MYFVLLCNFRTKQHVFRRFFYLHWLFRKLSLFCCMRNNKATISRFFTPGAKGTSRVRTLIFKLVSPEHKAHWRIQVSQCDGKALFQTIIFRFFSRQNCTAAKPRALMLAKKNIQCIFIELHFDRTRLSPFGCYWAWQGGIILALSERDEITVKDPRGQSPAP